MNYSNSKDAYITNPKFHSPILKQSYDEHIDISFTHVISTKWTMSNIHFHDHFELNLSISGGNRFFINDRVYHAQKGDLFFFDNKDLHKNIVPIGSNYDRFLIFFDPQLIEFFAKDELNPLLFMTDKNLGLHNRIQLSSDELFTLIQLLNDIIHKTKLPEFNNLLYKKIKLIEVLMLIQSYIKKRLSPYHSLSNSHSDSSLIHEKVQPIVTYINEFFHEALTLDFLSHKFYINKSYLCKLFKSETGFTINEYITNKRIIYAKELLLLGHSVTEVSRMIGYQNDTHFIGVFKNSLGITPKQYALKHS